MRNKIQTRSRALFLSAVSVLTLTHCASAPRATPEAPKAEAPQASGNAMKAFKEGESLYKSKKYPQAAKKLYSFATANPNTSVTDDAYFYLGQMAFEQGDYQRASQYWTAVVDGSISTEFFDPALVGAAQARSSLGQTEEAYRLISRFRLTDKTDPSLALKAKELSSQIKLQRSDPVGAIDDLLIAMKLSSNPDQQRSFLNRATELVYGNLTEGQLSDVLSEARFSSVQPAARFRMGMINFEKKNWASAKRDFLAIADKVPGSPLADRAKQYLQSLDAQQTADARTIGVILPLTGKFSQLGYKTLRGIQMALGLHTSTSPFKLAVIDSEGNPDLARRGVERLVTEDRVVAIIGDVQAKTAHAVAFRAQEFGVPCITLSQKTDLIDVGEFIFRNTLTADMQMKTLVDLAMNSYNLKRFAVIYPNDQYGTEYATAFWDYVLLKGGKVTAAQAYDPDETDFRHVVQRAVGTFYAEDDRGREFKMRLEEYKKNQKSKSAREKPPADLMPPIADFDAVFIPDNPKTTGQIAAMLAYNDVPRMTLLGTNLWNTPQIIARGGKFVEKALFVDSYFPEDSRPEMKKFNSEFEKAFGYKPDVFEVQGYDAAALVASAIRSANMDTTRLGLRELLSKSQNITGATSTLRVSSSREVEKSLVPLTIENGTLVEYKTGPKVQ